MATIIPLESPVKTCSECKETLPLNRFWKRTRNKDGRSGRCGVCQYKRNAKYMSTRPDLVMRERERTKRWQLANPHLMFIARRKQKLKRVYGLTLEQLANEHAARNGCCDICARQCEVGPVHGIESKCTLVIDHCHATKTFRGLLCMKCNTAIGLFGDDPNALDIAIRYLRLHVARGRR